MSIVHTWSWLRTPASPFQRSWRRNWIILSGVIVHAGYGVVLLFSSAPLHVSALAALATAPQYVVAGIYLGASFLALLPIAFPRLDMRFIGVLYVLPQQWLMMSCFWIIGVAIYRGQYPDGYVPLRYGNPHLFILQDQLLTLINIAVHTCSVLDWHFFAPYATKSQQEALAGGR